MVSTPRTAAWLAVVVTVVLGAAAQRLEAPPWVWIGLGVVLCGLVVYIVVAQHQEPRKQVASDLDSAWQRVGVVVRRRAHQWRAEHGMPPDVDGSSLWQWQVPGERDPKFDSETFEEAWHGDEIGRNGVYPLIQKATDLGAVKPEEGAGFQNAETVADLAALNPQLVQIKKRLRRWPIRR